MVPASAYVSCPLLTHRGGSRTHVSLPLDRSIVENPGQRSVRAPSNVTRPPPVPLQPLVAPKGESETGHSAVHHPRVPSPPIPHVFSGLPGQGKNDSRHAPLESAHAPILRNGRATSFAGPQ
eukprot:5562019-Alexandrium_andersonii.AAC.1